MPVAYRTRAIVYGLAAAIATLFAIGLPTDIIPNPIFSRMIETRPQDYVFLGITAVLAGVLGATYAYPAACKLQEGKWAGGGVLSFFAVGCPICNKLILLMLGTSGALTYFEPIQPILAVIGVALLALAVWIRIRAIVDPSPLSDGPSASHAHQIPYIPRKPEH